MKTDINVNTVSQVISISGRCISGKYQSECGSPMLIHISFYFTVNERFAIRPSACFLENCSYLEQEFSMFIRHGCLHQGRDQLL